jgi:hypothetical protein
MHGFRNHPSGQAANLYVVQSKVIAPNSLREVIQKRNDCNTVIFQILDDLI